MSKLNINRAIFFVAGALFGGTLLKWVGGIFAGVGGSK